MTCTVPRCGQASLFELVGKVGGNYEARCLAHAEAAAEHSLDLAVARLEAIQAVEIPGQMRLG